MMKKEWTNYGDVTPQEGGRYLKEFTPGCYDVAAVVYFDDVDKYIIDRYQIDIADIDESWIDKKDVMSFLGMTEEDFDPIWFLLGAVDYYGSANFGSEPMGLSSYTALETYMVPEGEVVPALENMGIEV